MGSWMRCICGGLIHTNMFTGTSIYQLIKDADYDAVEDPVDRDKLSDLFFKKGVTVYRCHSCGRLLVEWDDKGAPTFYLPEGKVAEIPEPEAAALQGVQNDDEGPKESESNQPDDPRLKELEALAEAAYDEMYDSLYPTGCYSRAKEAFYDAIALAARLGRQKDVERLERRLQHVKHVFRNQFA